MRKSIAAAAALMLLGLGGAQAQDGKLRWKMQSAFPGSLPVTGPLSRMIVEKLDAMSGGDIQIKLYEPGALVPALQTFDSVSAGAVESGWTSAGFWTGKIPAATFFNGVPFGPDVPEYLGWMKHGGGQQLYDEIYGRYNVKGLICTAMPPEAAGWFRKEIRGLDDLKGLKMRFLGLGAKTMEKLGVSTQLIAVGDVYPALELGTIDAAEIANPAIDAKIGLQQVAKWNYFPGWHQQTTLLEVIVNGDKWKALSTAHKAMFETACEAGIAFSMAEGGAIQPDAIDALKAKGVKLERLPPEILTALEAAWKEVAAEESAKDPEFKKVWESLSAFRARYAEWRKLSAM
jgi:TRAP-type mannitol/chloroaromatic compound transport system substrate-binding protein